MRFSSSVLALCAATGLVGVVVSFQLAPASRALGQHRRGSSLSSARWAVPPTHGGLESMPALLTEKQREATVAVYTDAIKDTTRTGQTWENAVRADEAARGVTSSLVSDSSLDLDIPIIRAPFTLSSAAAFVGVPLLLLAGVQLYNNRDKLGGSEQAEDPIEKMSTQGILDKLYEEIESKVQDRAVVVDSSVVERSPTIPVSHALESAQAVAKPASEADVAAAAKAAALAKKKADEAAEAAAIQAAAAKKKAEEEEAKRAEAALKKAQEEEAAKKIEAAAKAKAKEEAAAKRKEEEAKTRARVAEETAKRAEAEAARRKQKQDDDERKEAKAKAAEQEREAQAKAKAAEQAKQAELKMQQQREAEAKAKQAEMKIQQQREAEAKVKAAEQAKQAEMKMQQQQREAEAKAAASKAKAKKPEPAAPPKRQGDDEEWAEMRRLQAESDKFLELTAKAIPRPFAPPPPASPPTRALPEAEMVKGVRASKPPATPAAQTATQAAEEDPRSRQELLQGLDGVVADLQAKKQRPRPPAAQDPQQAAAAKKITYAEARRRSAEADAAAPKHRDAVVGAANRLTIPLLKSFMVEQGPGLLGSKAKKGEYAAAVADLAIQAHKGDAAKAIDMLSNVKRAAKKDKSDK